jgi:hypothetical protein
MSAGRVRSAWILAAGIALFCGGAGTTLLINALKSDGGIESPEWASITTSAHASDALACYLREAKWQALTYCASPVEDIVEVVWASCFGEEQNLLLASINDSGSDAAGMAYLDAIQRGARAPVISIIETTRSTAPRCNGRLAGGVQ